MVNMRNILTTLFLLSFWSCTACNGNSQNNDSDNILDFDHDSQNLSDFDAFLNDEIAENEKPDSDSDDGYCSAPDKADFPYYDKNGKMHFCRPCDLENSEFIKKDPSCVSNLWRFENEKKCGLYPKYDCCGYPCEIKGIEPVYWDSNVSKCDIDPQPLVDGQYWTGGSGRRHWSNISDGKLGFIMSAWKPDYMVVSQYRAFEYDMNNKSYKVFGPASLGHSYHKGSVFTTTFDFNKIKNVDDVQPGISNYWYYYSNGKYQVAYDKPSTAPSYPTMNEKWVAASFGPLDKSETSGYRYAKIGEWKWQQLNESLSWGQVQGDTLIFGTWEQEVFWCDLSKNPKSTSDCIKVNRSGESGVYAIMDTENAKRGAFTDYGHNIMYIVTLGDDGKLSYESVIPEKTEETHVGFSTSYLTGDMLLYGEGFSPNGGNEGKMCFYNLKTKKQYCSKPVIKNKDGFLTYYQGDAMFEGKWMAWQNFSSGMMIRDMECYCKENPEICPFDDYLPKTLKSKDISK
jgi:hypothetical protein